MSNEQTATERLRELLDERGVEYDTHGERYGTWYDTPLGGRVYVGENNAGYLHVKSDAMNPEQAIAATLGDADATAARQCDADELGNDGVERTNDGIAERGTCHDVWDTELTGRLRFQCSECGGVSLEITPHFCPCCGRKVGGRMSDKTDTIGTDCGHVQNVSATERLRELLDERGVGYDVRDGKAIKNTYWDDAEGRRWGYTSDESGVIKDRQLFLVHGRMDITPEQAVAASLGNDGLERSKNGVDERETCHNVAEPDEMNDRPFRCSECGARAPFDGTYHMGESYELDGMRVFADSWPTWRFCPCCGRKVVFE